MHPEQGRREEELGDEVTVGHGVDRVGGRPLEAELRGHRRRVER
jgi:hypothetical protein